VGFVEVFFQFSEDREWEFKKWELWGVG
jgi:hypothetical protein